MSNYDDPQTKKVFGIMVCILILATVLTGSNVTGQEEPKVPDELFVPGVIINVVTMLFVVFLLYIDMRPNKPSIPSIPAIPAIPAITISNNWDAVSPCIDITNLRAGLGRYFLGYIYLLVILLGSSYALAYGILTTKNIQKEEEENSYSNKALFSTASMLVGSLGIMIALSDIVCNLLYLVKEHITAIPQG